MKSSNLIKPGPREKVLSFGELLLRVCPDTKGDWLNENRLSFYVGGAESNVATALALWKIPSVYFTVLPDQIISHQIISYLQKKDIITSVIYGGDRIGLLFLPKDKDIKTGGIVYDRINSSFYSLQPDKINWKKEFEGITWFHFSAISPALNNTIADICKEAVRVATSLGITISVDLNYRHALWQYGKLPVEIMPGLIEYCDVVMGNIWAAEKMLGIPMDKNTGSDATKNDYIVNARICSEAIIKEFPKVKAVANTFRFESREEEINYYTTLFIDDVLYTSKEYYAKKVTDKVGSGDCYMAGLIYGFYKNLPVEETIEYATAAAFSKLFVAGDATTKTVTEVQRFFKDYGK